MSQEERQTGIYLAVIFALRMFGLFIILPVFSVYAATLPGGTDARLVGLALGAFGAVQAFLHIPLGWLSDRIGRRPVIIGGLLVYAAGCFFAVLTHTLGGLILARAIQGMGAISAAVTALAADLTREAHRTKVMAMIGASIGLTFACALVVAPALYAWVGMAGIFTLTGLGALAAIAVLHYRVPAQPIFLRVPTPVPLRAVLCEGRLLRLNLGVLMLHAMQTAMWVSLPAALAQAGLPVSRHWQMYLPVILASFAFMVPAVIQAERRGRLIPIFLGAVFTLLLAQGLFASQHGLTGLGLGLLLFFIGFNIMEALQPSLISRFAPGDARGAAMGVYNTTQSVGLACGGIIGGWLYQQGGALAVHVFCAGLAVVWLAITFFWPTQPPRPQDATPAVSSR